LLASFVEYCDAPVISPGVPANVDVEVSEFELPKTAISQLNQVQLENWSLPIRKTTVLDLDKV
jgi:hypothetical protein